MGRVLNLYEAEPGSVLSTTYGSPNPTGVILQYREKSKP